jgi:type IV pilus assembly protein PilM
MFFSKKKSIVGVDIGTSYIKVAQVTHESKYKVLDTYGMVNVAGQIDMHNNDAAILQTANALKTLLSQAGVTSRRCVASLPNSAVFTSVIDMPKMSQKELDSAIKFEAKKYVPLPFADVSLSWSVLSASDNDKLKVLLIAVPKQVRESYLKVFETAGLELEIVEIEALALIRSLVVDTTKNDVIIDIGAKNTGLNTIKQGLLQLTRNLNIGGDTITDKIAQSLNISMVRAEQFKKDFGVTQSTFLPEAIKPVLNIIKNEVRQLLTIYQSHNFRVDSIILTGGGANLPGIVEFFASDLAANVVLGNALAGVAYHKETEAVLQRFQTQLPIAIGLGLRNED